MLVYDMPKSCLKKFRRLHEKKYFLFAPIYRSNLHETLNHTSRNTVRIRQINV